MPFSSDGGTGLKVSENYLADGRLIGWIYSAIYDLVAEPDYIEPTGDPNQWLKPVCIQWLKVRGQNSEGKVDELKQHIITIGSKDEIMEKRNCLPN
mgnify:CR=1 FL=1